MLSFIKECYSKGLYTDDDLLTIRNGGMITDSEYNSLIDA